MSIRFPPASNGQKKTWNVGTIALGIRLYDVCASTGTDDVDLAGAFFVGESLSGKKHTAFLEFYAALRNFPFNTMPMAFHYTTDLLEQRENILCWKDEVTALLDPHIQREEGRVAPHHYLGRVFWAPPGVSKFISKYNGNSGFVHSKSLEVQTTDVGYGICRCYGVLRWFEEQTDRTVVYKHLGGDFISCAFNKQEQEFWENKLCQK